MIRAAAGIVLLGLALGGAAVGQSGHLVAVGGGGTPAAARKRFVELAGGERARIVVVPTASRAADDDPPAAWTEPWRGFRVASIEVLHTRSPAEADTVEFAEPLSRATGVWFSGGSQSRLTEAYLGTRVEAALADVLARGGVVGGTSAGAAVLGRVMIAGGHPVADVATGFGLWPAVVVDQHFVARGRRPRLEGVLADRPGLVGVGIDEGTAAIVDLSTGRLDVLGDSTVTILFGPEATILRAGEGTVLPGK